MGSIEGSTPPVAGTSGGSREMPVTSWGLVAGVRSTSTTARRTALENLCRRYWKPVYYFCQGAGWCRTEEDARDFTQAFFLELLEGEDLEKYDLKRGTFRTYLKVVLRGFAADRRDAMKALKRGGGTAIVPLDDPAAPLQDFIQDPQSEDPDRVFDRAWKKEVLDRAIERTRNWFESSERAVYFKVFEAYDLENPGTPARTYAELARELGRRESDVRNYLHAVREHLRTEIRMELAQTVTDNLQLEAEWKQLFGS